MIDRDARQRAIALLEALLGEGIGTYKLEDSWPTSTRDKAIKAIREQLWLVYDDFPERLLKRECFTPGQVEMVERCLLFLRSERVYCWSEYSPRTGNRTLLERLFGIGKKRMDEDLKGFNEGGDLDAWPFLSRGEYETELKTRRVE